MVGLQFLAKFWFILPCLESELFHPSDQVKAIKLQVVGEKFEDKIFKRCLDKCQSLRSHAFPLIPPTALHLYQLAINRISMKSRVSFQIWGLLFHYLLGIFMAYTLFSVIERMNVHSSNNCFSFVRSSY